ncbi:flagellar biosynthesis protein FliW [Helicobacter monodelphidis]|uniref:flagellar assembly protein FliW n=1 Tax=Helicobacter sp. 15-1451 TaxID=2004995 RepID=UPI000DCC0972|nr:flagellar assembly protein FliW [Helicobacter sp. 15-1451]RAX57916.1 flagellar biosynthesis protein FliW [Helicobacter sp. 15-1451]
MNEVKSLEFEVKSPILGFEDVACMTLERIDDLFMRLRNRDAEAPSFTMVNPYMLRQYEFEIPIALKILLDIQEKTNLLVLNMMVITNPLERSTVNFLAPVLFNFDNKTMGQVVLETSRYPAYGIEEPISSFFIEEGDPSDS